MNNTVEGYLAQLRRALAGSDSALVQDAVYDAEGYLRTAVAEGDGSPESLDAAIESYGTIARFSAIQPEAIEMQVGDNVRNIWELEFPAGVLTELSLKLGVGESTVDLRDVDVRDLQVTTGVGSTKIDLSGERSSDIDARIECGVGETVIRVPSDMGVRIIGGNDGVGDLSAAGFQADGDALVNDAYGSAGPKLEIRLTRGVGDIRIEQIQ